MQLSLLTSFQLIERDTQLNSYLLLIILLCFAFVGIARVAQPDLITQTFVGFFKMKRIDNSGFEGNKLQPSMTALIILNYLVSLGMGAFLILVKYNSAWLAVNFSFLIILTLTSLQVINFRLASLLSGEKPILDMIQKNLSEKEPKTDEEDSKEDTKEKDKKADKGKKEKEKIKLF